MHLSNLYFILGMSWILKWPMDDLVGRADVAGVERLPPCSWRGVATCFTALGRAELARLSVRVPLEGVAGCMSTVRLEAA